MEDIQSNSKNQNHTNDQTNVGTPKNEKSNDTDKNNENNAFLGIKEFVNN